MYTIESPLYSGRMHIGSGTTAASSHLSHCAAIAFQVGKTDKRDQGLALLNRQNLSESSQGNVRTYAEVGV